jgi:predicted nuclease of predicted toxin-antitoxin system
VKLFFDQNLSYRLCLLLADVFPGSEQATRALLDRATDDAIWAFARREGFTIVTLDADFADIATLRGAPPKVIWLRCGNQTTAFVERLLRDHAALIANFVDSGDAACLELY